MIVLFEKQVHLQNEEGSVVTRYKQKVLVREMRVRHERDVLAANTPVMLEKILKKSKYCSICNKFFILICESGVTTSKCTPIKLDDE